MGVGAEGSGDCSGDRPVGLRLDSEYTLLPLLVSITKFIKNNMILAKGPLSALKYYDMAWRPAHRVHAVLTRHRGCHRYCFRPSSLVLVHLCRSDNLLCYVMCLQF